MPTNPTSLLKSSYVVHAGGLAALAATMVSDNVLSRMDTRLAACGYLGTMALVLIVWSAVLSLRARWHGDESRWWKVVPAFALLELNAISVLIFFAPDNNDYWTLRFRFIESGLPLFLPYFSLVMICAALLSRWRVRVKYADASDRVQIVKLWRYIGALTVVSSVVLLPIPLFIYCACPPSEVDPRMFYWDGKTRTWNWNVAVADGMPDFVRDKALDCLAVFPNQSEIAIDSILCHGRCSRERLFSHLYAPLYRHDHTGPTDREFAFQGCARTEPQIAMELAICFARGTAGMAWSRELAWKAGCYLGRNASHGEIVEALREPKDKYLLAGLLEQLREDGRREFAPDIQDLVQQHYGDEKVVKYEVPAQSFYVDRELLWTTLEAQSELGDQDALVDQWSSLLSDPEREKLREIGIWPLRATHNLHTRLTTIMNAWDFAASIRGEDASIIRYMLLSEPALQDQEFTHPTDDEQQTLISWMKWLCFHSKDQDIVIRRSVAWQQAQVLRRSISSTPYPYTMINVGACSERRRQWNDAAVSASSSEKLECVAVNDEAQAWIAAETAARVTERTVLGCLSK